MKLLHVLLLATLASLGLAQTGINDAGIPWGTIVSGSRSNIRQFETHAFINQSQLENYWVNRSGQTGPVPRGTNFQTDVVVAIHLGDRPTGGFSVFVDKVQRVQASNIQVHYVEQKPDASQIVSTVVTQPWVLVRVRKVGGNITFSGSVRTGPPTIGIISPGPGFNPGGPGGGSVPFQPMLSGLESGASTFKVEIIQSQGELVSYLNTYHRGGTANIRGVDFSRDALVAIHLGRRTTGGYSVAVTGVEPSQTGLRVFWVEYRPGPDSMNTQALTSPFTIIRVPRAGAYDFVSAVRFAN